MKRTASMLAATVLLAACGEGARPVSVATVPAPRLATIPPAGLERVMGQDAAQLTRLFGQPDADVREGPGRKLQFIGRFCVLDAYLYPPKAPGGAGEARVTWLDTREPDGSTIDRAKRVAALTRREGK